MDHVARRSEKGAVWLGAMVPQDKHLVIVLMQELWNIHDDDDDDGDDDGGGGDDGPTKIDKVVQELL